MAPRGALSGSSGSDGWRPPSHSEAEVGDTCAAAASSRAPEVWRVAGRGVLRCPAPRPAAPVVPVVLDVPGAPGVSEVVMMPAQPGVISVLSQSLYVGVKPSFECTAFTRSAAGSLTPPKLISPDHATFPRASLQ